MSGSAGSTLIYIKISDRFGDTFRCAGEETKRATLVTALALRRWA
jgi:hypothetical protein